METLFKFTTFQKVVDSSTLKFIDAMQSRHIKFFLVDEPLLRCILKIKTAEISKRETCIRQQISAGLLTVGIFSIHVTAITKVSCLHIIFMLFLFFET